jgi:hypothetical protein
MKALSVKILGWMIRHLRINSSFIFLRQQTVDRRCHSENFHSYGEYLNFTYLRFESAWLILVHGMVAVSNWLKSQELVSSTLSTCRSLEVLITERLDPEGFIVQVCKLRIAPRLPILVAIMRLNLDRNCASLNWSENYEMYFWIVKNALKTTCLKERTD